MRQIVLSFTMIAVLLGLSFPVAAEPSNRGVLILDYHTFLDSKNSSIDFSLEEFATQLDAITAMGYHFVSMEDAIAGRLEGNRNVVLTIDDGNHSNYQAYQSVIAPRGIKPVLFIYPAIVLGHIPYALTQDQLVELAAAGCTIGAHGYHHNPVSSHALEKNPKDFLAELSKPGPALNRLTGTTPTLFAYPFGVYCPEAEKVLADEKYSWAFAADNHPVWVRFDDPGLDRMAVPRVIVYRWNQKLIFKTMATQPEL